MKRIKIKITSFLVDKNISKKIFNVNKSHFNNLITIKNNFNWP